MSGKLIGIGAVGVALALTVTACGGGGTTSPGGSNSAAPSATTVKIMVGGMNKQIYLSAKLTEQLGYFKDQNLDVQLSDEPSGVDAEEAMLAGQVDAVVGFYDHTIDLAGKGKQAESVVQLQQAPGEVELCRSDLADSIKSPADFKGKKLGVTGLGSSTNFLTKYLAAKAGLQTSDITSIAVGAGATFIAAMQKKEIDCGMTTEPTISKLLTDGTAKVLVDMRTPEGAKAALGGTYPAASVYMQTAWVNSHKDAVQKVVNAFVKTQKWIASHTAAEITDKMPADYYKGVGKDAYIKALDDEKAMYTPDGIMPADGPQTVYNVLSAWDPNVKGHNIDLTKTYTTDFVKKAS
jgi:NitT/TauT family transport system substrate-binding protein